MKIDKIIIGIVLLALMMASCSKYGKPDPCYPRGKDWATVTKTKNGWHYSLYRKGLHGRELVCETLYECLPDSLKHLIKS